LHFLRKACARFGRAGACNCAPLLCPAQDLRRLSSRAISHSQDAPERKTKSADLRALFLDVTSSTRGEGIEPNKHSDEADTSHIALAATGKRPHCTICDKRTHTKSECFEGGGGRSNWTKEERTEFFDQKKEDYKKRVRAKKRKQKPRDKNSSADTTTMEIAMTTRDPPPRATATKRVQPSTSQRLSAKHCRFATLSARARSNRRSDYAAAASPQNFPRGSAPPQTKPASGTDRTLLLLQPFVEEKEQQHTPYFLFVFVFVYYLFLSECLGACIYIYIYRTRAAARMGGACGASPTPWEPVAAHHVCANTAGLRAVRLGCSYAVGLDGRLEFDSINCELRWRTPGSSHD
jgi:hypothetical protein